MGEWGNILELISDRSAEIRDAMEKEGASVADQKHLDKGAPERAYWHAGYLTALDDLLAIIQRGNARNAA